MTVRLALSCLIIVFVVAASLLSLGAANGSGSAFGAPVPAVIEPGSAAGSAGSGSGSSRPSDGLADPVADPAGAISDAREAKSHGWAILSLAALIMVSRGLGTARRRWPTSAALRWMAGRTGLVVIGAGVVGAAAFDALLLGGSWWAAGYAAIGAALSLLVPEPPPPASVVVPGGLA